MKVQLSERELEIIECLVRGWIKNDCRIPGGISYQCVIDLLKSLGADAAAVTVAEHIEEFSRWAKETTR